MEEASEIVHSDAAKAVEVGPRGFQLQTRADEATFIAHAATPVLDEEISETIKRAQAVAEKHRKRPDYGPNLKMGAKMQKVGNDIVPRFYFYTETPSDDATKPAAHKVVSAPECLSAIGRLKPGSFMQVYGNYQNGPNPASLDQAKGIFNLSYSAGDASIPEDMLAELHQWFMSIHNFQWNEWFEFQVSMDSSKTLEALRASCTPDGSGSPSFNQDAVRNAYDPSADRLHLPFSSPIAYKELLNGSGKKARTTAKADPAKLRAEIVKTILHSWVHVDENPWFYGMEDAAGNKASETCQLMQEFREKSTENVHLTRDTAAAYTFSYTPVIGPDGKELSAASRETIMANASAYLIFVEYKMPVPGKIITNIGHYARTVYVIGRVTPQAALSEKRRDLF